MYCPSCGKDNAETARFCRACGRNLAGIRQPASPESESAFERIEHRLDEIIAGYASRYFKGRAGPFVPPTTLKESWKLLGQGFLTVLGDLIFTYLVVQFVLQFRLWVLLSNPPRCGGGSEQPGKPLRQQRRHQSRSFQSHSPAKSPAPA